MLWFNFLSTTTAFQAPPEQEGFKLEDNVAELSILTHLLRSHNSNVGVSDNSNKQVHKYHCNEESAHCEIEPLVDFVLFDLIYEVSIHHYSILSPELLKYIGV